MALPVGFYLRARFTATILLTPENRCPTQILHQTLSESPDVPLGRGAARICAQAYLTYVEQQIRSCDEEITVQMAIRSYMKGLCPAPWSVSSMTSLISGTPFLIIVSMPCLRVARAPAQP